MLQGHHEMEHHHFMMAFFYAKRGNKKMEQETQLRELPDIKELLEDKADFSGDDYLECFGKLLA